ncbi:MAG: HPP family protein [Chloroflexi bacterium]|nr:HPP family protein [Chloroflexota bacterium]
MALFNFINAGVSIGVMAAAATVSRALPLFLSLGPTAFLLFSMPMEAVALPRNTLCGHLLGAVAGWASLGLFQLTGAPPEGALGWAHMGAATLALSVTNGLMVLRRMSHPPASATALLVVLGGRA